MILRQIRDQKTHCDTGDNALECCDSVSEDMKNSSSNLPVYSPDLMHRWSKESRGVSNKTIYTVLGVLIFGIFITFLNVYELRRMQNAHYSPVVEAISGTEVVARKPHTVWVHAKRMETGYLKHITNVFQRVGYSFGTRASDWDVLWTHDYPFTELSSVIHDLKPHQKLNHFPGSGYITNKVSLATSKIKFIPPAFKMPTEVEKLRRYNKRHPKTLWVQKSNNHRGVKIKSLDELDLSSEDTFVQVYISNPYLIDKRKFDVGVYAVLTSINPLRVYILENDILLRFCPEDYYPFDARNVNKYVVGDSYTPTWEIPSLQTYFTDMSYSYKETLNAYLRQNGRNETELWADVQSAILGVYLEQERFLIRSSRTFKSTRNFFELVNMSPNLSSGHFVQNKQLYEQVVFNVLSLTGIARSVTDHMFNSYQDEINMQVSGDDIQVLPESCLQCAGDCLREECMWCHRCLSIDDRFSLQNAFLEHVNRRNMKRVFPPALTQKSAKNWDETKDHFFLSLNTRNRLMYNWFRGKCIQDDTWCS